MRALYFQTIMSQVIDLPGGNVGKPQGLDRQLVLGDGDVLLRLGYIQLGLQRAGAEDRHASVSPRYLAGSGMHTGITAAGLTLHVEGFEAPLHIDSDERRLQQLLSNVLKNALRYTNAASQLQVRWARRRRRLEIVIEDSAPDVAPDKSEVFVRALLPRRRLAHGLGLAICRNIVVAHDGQISATPSALGRLCVTLRLPALEA